jgi:hypothetical protein
MTPEILALLAQLSTHNLSDIETIVSKIGIKTLLEIMPNITNIIHTYQAIQDSKPA